jgi:hypothetical protein
VTVFLLSARHSECNTATNGGMSEDNADVEHGYTHNINDLSVKAVVFV